MVKGNNSSSYGDNKGVDEFWFIFVSVLHLALQQQGKYHTGTVRPKLLILGLGMCTRVHCGHFGPTGACRGLLGQFLWPRMYMVLYCTCM